MEGISASAYNRLKAYWKRRRRGYHRLNGPSDPTQTQSRPGTTRLWRLKVVRKVRVLRRVGSPKKWLTRLRDAYVRMMVRIADSGGGSVDYGFEFGRGPLKEYDDKVIVQIHKDKALVMP